MLSIATGHDVGYLTNPVAGGREGYYTGAVAAGEPAGLWYGAGTETLGLRGEVDADLMEAVYSQLLDPRDEATHSRVTWGEAEPLAKAHRTYRSADEVYAELLKKEAQPGPERRAELRTQAERSARQAVSFIDATFSAPKSVTVLGVAFERAANDARARGDHESAAAYAAHQKAVEDAVLAGARASLDYLQDKAGYSRIGHHGGGAGRWIDAHSFVVAQFLQHDSRDRDPQLHVHNAILNRVRCSDGIWRTLDSRAIHVCRAAAGAIGERVMEAHLTRALGVRFATRPDGQAREVVGVRQEIIDLFSSRRRAITAKAEKLVDAYRERHGREPTLLERTRIAMQATLATRAAKAHDGETIEQRLDRWEAETRTKVTGGLAEVANTVLARAQEIEPGDTWSPRDVIERALDAAGKGRQTWSRSDLLRAVSNALPGHLDIDPQRVGELLDGLTDAALDTARPTTREESTHNLPADLRLDDGRSCYGNPTGMRYATPGQLTAEETLRLAAVRRGAERFSAEDAAAVVTRFAESGCELGVDQATAVRGVLSSGTPVEVLSAPAGTGKSFVVGAIGEAWRGSGRRVFGLATSQIATQVLTEEGLDARNIARWLATQQRLDQAPPGGSDPGGDAAWRLQRGDLVIVDEAGMTDTVSLVEVHRRCEAAGAKLLLVGDPRQLAAVGPGGTLADLAEHGVRYELAEVRRFGSRWEATASLRLRDGDTTALDTYVKHGRILDAGTAEQAETAAARGWLADTLAGRNSLALVPTNEAAARLSATLRAELVALGRVEAAGVPLTRQGTVAGIGDLVQARRNGWDLIGHDGNTTAPINRRCYRVTATRDDGSLIVTDDDGTGHGGQTLTLPPAYVAEYLTLGYASTVHAAQGRTVDTAHTVIGPGTDAPGAYVGLTRGRHRNTAYCITRAVPDDIPPGAVGDTEERTCRAVLADILSRDDSAPAESATSALTQITVEAEAARSTKVSLDRLAAEITEALAGRTGTILDHLAADGALSPRQRAALAADPAYGSLERLLRTAEIAGHNAATVLADAVAERDLDDALHPARVLHSRINTRLQDQLTPRITSYTDLIPDGIPEEYRARLQDLAAGADERRRELGERVADNPPQWAREALGPVPTDVLARAEWEHRAGWAAAYRELADHTNDADALGPPPPAGLAETYTAWRVGHTALDLPDAGPDEVQMTDGRLRNHVRAYQREQVWAPRYVADELATTHQQAEQARTDATLWAVRAEPTKDETARAKLLASAVEASQRADELAERAAELEVADDARAKWFAATAPTRDAAARAQVQLGARGIDLDDPVDQVTAEEWLAAHHAEQAATDLVREIHDEAELHDPDLAADEAATDALAAADKHLLETAIPDIRQTTTQDATEVADPAQRHRIPTADETADAIRRAQQALAEIEARRQYDAARAAEDDARRAQLIRWADDARAADEELHREPEPVLEH